MDINRKNLVKLGTIAGTAAACLGIPSDLYHFTIDSRAAGAGSFLFAAHGIGLVSAMLLSVLALSAMTAVLGERIGSFGVATVAAAYVGTLLVLGNIATEAFYMPLAPEVIDNPTGYTMVVIVFSYAMYTAGWLGMGALAWRSGLASKPASALLCVGALYAFTPFPGSYILLLAGTALTLQSMVAERRPTLEAAVA